MVAFVFPYSPRLPEQFIVNQFLHSKTMLQDTECTSRPPAAKEVQLRRSCPLGIQHVHNQRGRRYFAGGGTCSRQNCVLGMFT